MRGGSCASVYRYGFNGKENDNEVKGEGNQIDYGMRVYDPRIGKFLSVDPLSSKYPWYTPYQFSGNTPIQAVDIDGREDVHYIFIWVKAATGKETVLKLHGWSEGNETGRVDAQGRAVYDRPYKVHAHYPTNLYGRTVFSSATYDSEEAFSNAKAGDFTMSAIGAASEVSAEIANEVGGTMAASYLFAKAGNYLTTKTISMLVDAKAAQYTASSVNRAAVDNLIKQNVDDALVNTVSAAELYPGVAKEYAKQTINQLQKTIRSTAKTIAEHKEWLKNPLSKPGMTADKWNTMDERARSGLLRKWAGDIKRNEAYQEIAEGLLKSKTTQ